MRVAASPCATAEGSPPLSSTKRAIDFDKEQEFENWKRTKNEKESVVQIAYALDRIADSFVRMAEAAEAIAAAVNPKR